MQSNLIQVFRFDLVIQTTQHMNSRPYRVPLQQRFPSLTSQSTFFVWLIYYFFFQRVVWNNTKLTTVIGWNKICMTETLLVFLLAFTHFFILIFSLENPSKFLFFFSIKILVLLGVSRQKNTFIFTFLTAVCPFFPLCIAGCMCGRPRRRKPWRLRAWLSGQALPVTGQRTFPDGSGASTRSGNRRRGGRQKKIKNKAKHLHSVETKREIKYLVFCLGYYCFVKVRLHTCMQTHTQEITEK